MKLVLVRWIALALTTPCAEAKAVFVPCCKNAVCTLNSRFLASDIEAGQLWRLDVVPGALLPDPPPSTPPLITPGPPASQPASQPSTQPATQPATRPAGGGPDLTNVQIGGRYGGYDVKSGAVRYVWDRSISKVQRGINMENKVEVKLLDIKNCTISSVNYCIYADSPAILRIQSVTGEAIGGGDDYGLRALTPKVEIDGLTLTNNGKNKACFRIGNCTAGWIKGLKCTGGPAWFGGGASDGSSFTDFSDVNVQIEQVFSADNPNRSAMQFFPKAKNSIVTGSCTLPEGKMLATVWNGAVNITFQSFTVNGVLVTEANKAQYIDGGNLGQVHCKP